MENWGFGTLFRPATIQPGIELGQIYFLSGRDFDLSYPNQVWDKKYLNRRTGDNPAKTSSQKAKIPPNRKRYFLALFSQAAIPSKIEQGVGRGVVDDLRPHESASGWVAKVVKSR